MDSSIQKELERNPSLMIIYPILGYLVDVLIFTVILFSAIYIFLDGYFSYSVTNAHKNVVVRHFVVIGTFSLIVAITFFIPIKLELIIMVLLVLTIILQFVILNLICLGKIVLPFSVLINFKDLNGVELPK